MAISGQPLPVVEVTPTEPPPAPPYSEVFTPITAVSQLGTCALRTVMAVEVFAVSRRRTLPPPQNVASKYVAGMAPEPVEPSPHVAGSSAPESVEVTSIRQMLKILQFVSKGGVCRNTSAKCCASCANLLSSDCW